MSIRMIAVLLIVVTSNAANPVRFDMELLMPDGNEGGGGGATNIKPYSKNHCYWQYRG